jgi:hypothetical protein
MRIDPALLAALAIPSSTLRDLALDMARQGYAVVPCHVRTPGGCTCGLAACACPGEHALVLPERASRDPEQIRSWWVTWSGAAVGLVSGGQLQRVLIAPSPSPLPPADPFDLLASALAVPADLPAPTEAAEPAALTAAASGYAAFFAP